MTPFKLLPAFQDYLWGGSRLKTQFHKQTELEIVAESWELSAHADGDCTISGGEQDGMRFSEYLRAFPQASGRNNADSAEFPILIKLIDACKSLSVQVHPDDIYARREENSQGKTEMWYILDCEPGAFLYFGLTRETTKDELRRRIEEGTLTELLHAVPVHTGDVFFIEAGTIHAIGAGILLAEIQQNSNMTYRVYDFGRLGADGKPRALHVEKALEVSRLSPSSLCAPGAGDPVQLPGGIKRRLADCPYFTVDSLTLESSCFLAMDGGSFVSLLCTEGGASLDCDGYALNIAKGDSIFIPANDEGFVLDGRGDFLITTRRAPDTY